MISLKTNNRKLENKRMATIFTKQSNEKNYRYQSIDGHSSLYTKKLKGKILITKERDEIMRINNEVMKEGCGRNFKLSRRYGADFFINLSHVRPFVYGENAPYRY